MKRLLDQLDNVVRDAVSIRHYVETRMHPRPFFPDRRHPGHWNRELVETIARRSDEPSL